MGKIKLDKNDVALIKQFISEGKKDGEIAKIFDVSRKHISNIRRGKSWNYEYK